MQLEKGKENPTPVGVSRGDFPDLSHSTFARGKLTANHCFQARLHCQQCHIQPVAVSKSNRAVYGLQHMRFCMIASKSNQRLGKLSAIALTLHYIDSYTKGSRQAVYRLFLPEPSTLSQADYESNCCSKIRT